MKQYLDLLRHVLENGTPKPDRTGTGTHSVFGWQMRFDLSRGFPLVTTKRLHLRSIIHELIWFLQGDTNIRYLKENGVGIWDEWADAQGELGPVYGKQWRSWQCPDGRSIDQISWLIDEIRRNPDSRRLVVSAWNVADLDAMALQPCHTMFQFHVADGKLSCQLYQRSADIFLGVPFNIASYALLTHMIAQVCGLRVGDFVHTLGDAHLYLNHFDQAREQLSRTPHTLPKLHLNPDVATLFDFRFEHVTHRRLRGRQGDQGPGGRLIALVAALDRKLAIGRDGAMPWHLPDDLKRFKQLTLGKPVLMGRKTALSIGRALPGRDNLVMSRNGAAPFAGQVAVRSLDLAIERAGGNDLMVIGGGEIYALAMDRAERMHLTWVDTDADSADTYFPSIDSSHWKIVSEVFHAADAKHALSFRFTDFERA